jgi:hypothetical protein
MLLVEVLCFKEPADANVMRMIQPAVVPAIDKLGYARIASIKMRQRIYAIPFATEAELRTANQLRVVEHCTMWCHLNSTLVFRSE